MRRDTEELPTIVPMGDEVLQELLRAAEGIERPLDDRMILGRVTLTMETFRSMTRKAKLNKRFKRNRDKPVGRPKTHWKTKQKLKKANNRRNYLNRVKPELDARRATQKLEAMKQNKLSPSLPSEGEEGI